MFAPGSSWFSADALHEIVPTCASVSLYFVELRGDLIHIHMSGTNLMKEHQYPLLPNFKRSDEEMKRHVLNLIIISLPLS